MADEPVEDPILQPVHRASRFLAAGKITPEEFVYKLFDHFAHDPRAPIHLAAQVLAMMPESGKRAFVERVDEALRPEFRRQPFRYSGPVPEEQYRRDGQEQTDRVRAWAAEFRRLMDRLDQEASAVDH